MSRISHVMRWWLALGIWSAGLILFVSMGWWSVQSSRKDAENRLISEAGRAAAQIAAMLSSPTGVDPLNAKGIVSAAMEDERIYAVRVEARGVLEGERRNYLWEPVPWDDEIAETCVQGMNPVKIGGRPEGRVSVWLSPRLNREEDGLLVKRELTRFLIAACLWTAALILLLWHWGEFRRFARMWARKPVGAAEEATLLGLAKADAARAESPPAPDPFVNPQSGRDFQRRHPDAWLVTAGMFRQTFGKAPALIGRLYAEGELAGLCHLGRMLEQAAPCIGAAPLAQAARLMQNALNDPACEARALPVENCARALERTLAVLGSRNGAKPGARS